MPREHILIVADHSEPSKQMRDVLTDDGYQVSLVNTARQAIALAQKTSFSLLLADVCLPDSSAALFLKQIRLILPDLAGVVITDQSHLEQSPEALAAGYVGILVKPVMSEQLLATVVSALHQRTLAGEDTELRARVPLYELSQAFMGTVELKDLLDQIVSTVRLETSAEVVSLMLFEDNPNELRIVAAAGLPLDIVETERRILGEGIAGRVAQTGQPLMIADALPLDPEIRRAMVRPEIGSALSIPLRVRGQVSGVLNLSRRRGTEPFTQGDLELATVFAGQAAVAIDKTRLIADLRKLSDISQRLARAVDLDEACGAILSASVDSIRGRGAALWLIDGSLVPAVRSLGLENDALPAFHQETLVEEFRTDAGGSWLILPLRYGDRALGALAVRLATSTAPGEERMRTLQTIAHVAGAVVESHRLRARESLAFRQVDQAVRADLSLRDLLNRLLDEMIETCQADGGTLLLWNDERKQLEPFGTRGDTVSSHWAQSVLAEGKPLRTTDAQTGQFIVGAPMVIGNRTQGAVVLSRAGASGEFRPQHCELVSILTSTAALIVRNAQLYVRSEEAAIAEERTRIAREIHDGLAQELAYLVMKIAAAQRLASQGKPRALQKELRDISDRLRRGSRDVRRIIFALRPLEIESRGFLPALSQFVKEFCIVNELEVQINVQGDFKNLSPKLETALFRLAQEALNNVRKHAQAKRLWVDLHLDERRVALLRVRDDGIGFNLEQAMEIARQRGSVGLVQMRERAERAGGEFLIETAPNQGTLIQVTLPIRDP